MIVPLELPAVHRYAPASSVDTLNKFRVVPVFTADDCSVRPTLVQVYDGAGGPTASHRNVMSWPEDTVMSLGVRVKRGGPVYGVYGVYVMCVCACVHVCGVCGRCGSK